MTAERVYAALLHLYPKPFRDEYGDAMVETFHEMRLGSHHSSFAFWRTVLVDTLGSAAREHFDKHGFAISWTATCAFGLISTIAAAHAVAWAFSYFYHPYLEGLRILPWAYGAGLGLVLGGSVGLGQWALLPVCARRWALTSAIMLPIAILFCGTTVERALAGVNPVASSSYSDLLAVLLYGLLAPTHWTAVAAEFTAMTACGLAIGVLTSTQITEGHHAN
jgi:hypothetical protein